LIGINEVRSELTGMFMIWEDDMNTDNHNRVLFSLHEVFTPLKVMKIKTAELDKFISFGSSAALNSKTCCFPSPPYGGFGFIGMIFSNINRAKSPDKFLWSNNPSVKGGIR
jgi:hypothetical protein